MRAPVLSLQCSDLNAVSSYCITTLRHDCFANLWQRNGRWRAGDGNVFQVKLGIGVGNLQGFSNDGKGTEGDGGCLGMGGSTITG
jgi:hypothetical protein